MRRSAIKIAVTGGSGFIGTHVVQQLAEAGHQVVVIDVRPPAALGVAWRGADLLNVAEMTEAVRTCDAVYHLAAVSNVNEAFKDPMGCVDANLRGTANVLEAARLTGVRRVLFASTVWVYQASLDAEPTEATGFVPERAGHLYTASKIAGELLCHSYAKLYGLPVTILRYGIPYGPHMRLELLIPAFIKKALAGEPLTINGDGRQFRKFVYVEDLARGNVAALAPAAENQTFNIEGSQQISVLDIAHTLDRLLGGVRIQFLPARPGDFAGVPVDGAKAKRLLGWEPKVPFEEGLRRTLAWYFTVAPQTNGHRNRVAVQA